MSHHHKHRRHNFEAAVRAHIASRGAKGTRGLYEADFARWLTFCDQNDFDPTKPKLDDVAKFRDALEAENLEPLTRRRILAELSSMYSAVVDREVALASWNPFKRLQKPPADAYSATEAISDADAQALIGTAEQDDSEIGRRDTAILLLLYETGLRRASVATLKRADVFERDGATFVRVIAKGGKRREVDVPERAAKALREWMKYDDGVFVFADRSGKAIWPTAINRIMNARAKQANIQHVHPHQFRAAYATAALDAGVPINEVQMSMFHASPSMTVKYDRGARGHGVTSAVAKFREGKK